MKALDNRSHRPVHYYTVAVIGLFLSEAALQGQPDRIARQISNKERVALSGNVHPKAKPQFDRGPVESSMNLDYITLMLKPSGSQQAALEQLLAEQQDRASPKYHKWLSPEQYADRFGLSPADIGGIRSWLESQGFSIDHVARSRNWVAFSGTAAQVAKAFQTEIHYYSVDREKHFANASEPMIPGALESLVSGFLGLNDFRPPAPTSKLYPRPNLTQKDGTHYLAPDDIATIYDITRLYAKGFDGSGQRIVVVGQSNINPVDIADFRAMFGLSTNVPQVLLVPGTQDPGMTHAQGEADLDIEWVGAVARNATIIYVYSASFLDAVEYSISQNLAHIISTSFDICENNVSTADESFFRGQAQQANVQGITWVVSSGDSGAAACDKQNASPLASNGFAVYFPASIPEVTAVGGTEFADQGGNYWSGTTSPTGASALSYIPETAWNESNSANGLAASGGGLSIYPQPLWQIGPGVPNVNFRALPDVALAAASNHDGYLKITGGQEFSTGGTSAGTPVFAGIVALLNQHEGSNGVGNINPNLYRLAQTRVFHDIVSGDNIVECVLGSPDCSTGKFGYHAGPGYDLVTGLGSVDAYNLVADWNAPTPQSKVVPLCTPNPVYEQQPDAQGYAWFYTIILSETADVGTSLTGFTFKGADYSSQIVAYFGSSTIPAHGTIAVNLQARGLTVPTNVAFGFTGVDAGGRQWSQQLSVPFNGPQSSQTPTIGAVVSGASFAKGGIVPGEIATVFGSNLTSSTGINLTSSLPLPTKFLNDSVIINGSPVPLFAVDNVNGQQQFSFQVPWEVAGGPVATIAVSNSGTTSATISVPVLAAQPGTFVYNAGGNIFGAILHANFQLADSGHPAVAGETVLIYCTALGAVSSPPSDGAPGSGQTTVARPSVSIGGVSATVSFSGLAPGFVGLYQINTTIPAGVASGNQPMVITMGGSSSNSALLPIR